MKEFKGGNIVGGHVDLGDTQGQENNVFRPLFIRFSLRQCGHSKNKLGWIEQVNPSPRPQIEKAGNHRRSERALTLLID